MGVEMSLYYKLAALPASPQLPALPSPSSSSPAPAALPRWGRLRLTAFHTW